MEWVSAAPEWKCYGRSTCSSTSTFTSAQQRLPMPDGAAQDAEALISKFTDACSAFDINASEAVDSLSAVLDNIAVDLAQSRDLRYSSCFRITRRVGLSMCVFLGLMWAPASPCSGPVFVNYGRTLFVLS